MLRPIFSMVIVCVLLAPGKAWARQADEPGSKDHPMVPRLSGYHIASYEAQDFASHEFPMPNDQSRTVEGRYWQIVYYAKEGAKPTSGLEIARNYRNAFAAKGGKTLLADADGAGTVIQFTQGNGELWFRCTTVATGTEYSIVVVEKTVMEQQVALNAATIAAALNDKGSLALRNILFDTGRATLRPESATELGLVIEVLRADATLRLEVQGHTDSVGQPAANLALSQQRAAAVRDYLIKTGSVAAERLTAVGHGDTRPVAPNTTEVGRTENRRVEIVKK